MTSRVLTAALLALTATVAGAPEPARAFELHLLGAADTLLTTNPDFKGLSDAEIGYNVRADLRHVGNNRADFRLDFLGRVGLLDQGLLNRPGRTGNSTLNQLRELWAVVHLGSRVDLTLGRFTTPGSFWLVVDGARLSVKYTSWLSQSIYGGLRAFTTGRHETHLTDRPVVLYLAGTSLAARHKLVDAALTFTYAQDAIDLSNQYVGGRLIQERTVENDYFLQADFGLHPHPTLDLLGGARLGTRFDVQYLAANPYNSTQIAASTLGAISAWGAIEWQPLKRLRMTYLFNYERVRIYQSQLLPSPDHPGPMSAESGNFQDHMFRVVGLLHNTLRGELSYRLRLRDNSDDEHHVVAGLRDDRFVGNLGYFASVGVDVIHPAHIFFAPQLQTFTRIVYAAGVSYVNHYVDARAGLHYTDGIGSGLLSSPTPLPTVGNPASVLWPYALETNKVAFLQLFVTAKMFFAGFDREWNLQLLQMRTLLQVGVAL